MSEAWSQGHHPRWTSRCARLLTFFVVAVMLATASPAAAYVAGGNLDAQGAMAMTNCQEGGGLAWEYLAFIGTDGQVNLLRYPVNEPNSTSRADTVANQYYLHVYSPNSPAITCVNEPYGGLYMLWTDYSGRLNLGVIVLLNGTAQLQDVTRLPETSDGPPAIASDDGHNIVLGWDGTDALHHINIEDINLLTNRGTKYITTDYTVQGRGVSLAWNGIPYKSGDTMIVGFLSADTHPFSYIYLGQFTPEVPANFLSSVRTSQYSYFKPALSSPSGPVLAVVNGTGGGVVPSYGGPTEVLWDSYSTGRLIAGSWTGAGDISNVRTGISPDFTEGGGAVDMCKTAYPDANFHIVYDAYPFFGNCFASRSRTTAPPKA
ncbi:hypothetical protein ABH920_001990 [Catenulispora sp. EB89]|uniref:hypothetical protein n=1 Tax=Catenulispora sp. EB89 TaxID=3156257 RepID=UPI00351451FE